MEPPTLPPFFAKIRVGAATRSTSLTVLDQFSHILITMSVKGECWEKEYNFYFHIGLSLSCEIRLIQSQYWRSVSCGISETMGGNPTADLKILSGFLLGSC